MHFDEEENFKVETLESWILALVDEWRDFYRANYQEKHDEYMRLFKGVWSPEDRTRDSERSKIISPQLQQAVESSVAEVEEATFARGTFFTMKDDARDEDDKDIMALRNLLHEEFRNNQIRQSISEILINAAVYGTGIAEVVVEESEVKTPGSQPILDGELQAVGVNIRDKFKCKLKPIQPRNFFIDPLATTIENALGCGSDEYVSMHTIELLQEQGVYRDIPIRPTATEEELETNPDLIRPPDNKVRRIKYSGLVPRHLLEQAQTGEDEEIVALAEDPSDNSYYVEAVVVLGNGDLLKAEKNPHMMQDRDFVAFPWDITPGMFWGRGICEKGYNSQKALDTELRARIDALGLTVHPMMGVDATKLPRGSKPSVRPGKMLLTNGDPREVFHPFHFGDVDQITFAQAAELQKMVQTSTGAIDNTSVIGSIEGGRTSAGASMAIAPIVKRHKRTLVNFQEAFLIPFVKKAAWRYMQYDPDNFPIGDFKFNVTGTMGIIAREYEVTQLVQLLQTMSPDTPLYPVLIQQIIDNMNISNAEELKTMLQEAMQPSEEEQQAAQQQRQAQLEQQAAQTAAFAGQAEESRARALKAIEEAKAIPQEIVTDRLESLTKNIEPGAQDDRELQRRLQLFDRFLDERRVAIEEDRQDLARATAALNLGRPTNREN